ncbi:hypothetical protein COL922a_011609 [Colletotrichum nupharicola]|nr:hypothetical protein COL922a_011609 [Colletotrichum nupharicola]
MSNTADPSFREVKARQGGPTTRAADLFRLDGRTIINQLEKLATKFGLQLSYYHLDVPNENSITTVFKQLAPTLKYPIRGLVACAGVSDNDPAHEFSTERFRRLMEINVTGTFAAAQAVALEVKKANVDGSMVLVASMSGTNVIKGVDTAAYNSSKSAILQLARSLAAEWGSRKGLPLIRVNSLSPGYIRTPVTAEALQKPGMENQWTPCCSSWEMRAAS